MDEHIAPAVEVYASISKHAKRTYLKNYGTFSTTEMPLAQNTGNTFGAIVSGIVQCDEPGGYLIMVEREQGAQVHTSPRYVIQP